MSTSSDEIVEHFLDLVENEKCEVAVHCKDGLGRTGTLIALYAMKHYRFPARAFIGYIRICRPGSILGPQQAFLVQEQEKYFKLGDEYRAKKGINDTLIVKLENLNLYDKTIAIYSEKEEDIIERGDTRQGNRLNKEKKKKKNKKEKEKWKGNI